MIGCLKSTSGYDLMRVKVSAVMLVECSSTVGMGDRDGG